MTRLHLKRASPDQEFPNLCGNFTWMARVLTPAMYQRQFHRCTNSGVIFDDIIRPGLEAPGCAADWSTPASVGCAAGDAQSYTLFCDFFDRIIEAYHGRLLSGHTPKSDFNSENLKGTADIDQSYVVHCELSAVRAIDDFCFPTHCSRGERRRLLLLAQRALPLLEEDDGLPGCFLLVDELTADQQRTLNLQLPSALLHRCGVARDWPDARGVWVSTDGSLLVWVNLEDHLKVVTHRADGNIPEAFRRLCNTLEKLEASYQRLRHSFAWQQQLGWLSSSPADVGTGLRVRVTLRLKLLPEHRRAEDVIARLRLHMEKTECPALFCVCNVATFGMSEVGVAQLVVDGVKLIIAMEKRLEAGGDINHLVPTQK
ncbi:creatine kinase B-type isoform X2 [Nelusetta ayraudi]